MPTHIAELPHAGPKVCGIDEELLQDPCLSADLTARGITVVALREGVDSSTATGRAIAAIMASLAELELELGRERRAASRSARRAWSARHSSRLDAAQQARLVRLYRGGEPIAEVCSMFGVSRATAFRYIAAAKQRTG